MKPLSHHLSAVALAAGLAVTFFALPAPAQLVPSSPLDDLLEPPLDDSLLDDPMDDVEGQLEEGSFDEPFADGPIEEALGSDGVGDLLDGSVIGDPLDEAADGLDAPLDEALGDVQGTIEDTTQAVPGATQPAVISALGPLRPFVASVDPFGHAIEEDVLIALVEPAALTRLEQSGWTVAAKRRLPSLGLVMVRITGPAARQLAEAVGDLRAMFPDAAVDYNFLYRLADGAEAAPAGEDAAGSGELVPPGARLRLGLIDSAVVTDHPALAGVKVMHRDFAPHEGERPLGHGTAVASLLAQNGADDDAEILAASVFFQKPGLAPGATTESLVAAVDWLAGSGVDVINMSLAGPADALLERALDRIAKDGPIVVAAVGNNGPAGEPLYPAAYDSVVGVTAIDAERRVFPYANRGRHVAFAAPGVNVKVANSLGGFRLESGTSMASPHVAAAIAAALHGSGLPKTALLEALEVSAVDLGDDGFDPVFGHGLLQPQRTQNAAASLAE